MIFDFIKCTSSTGGTGALTLTRQTGFAHFTDAFTGTRAVYYTINEYTDSAKVILLQSETGLGSCTSAGVLTRATVPDATWVYSTFSYAPAYRSPYVAAVPLTFGSNAANIDIISARTADRTLLPIGAYNNSGSGADGIGAAPLGFSSSSLVFGLTSGNTYYFPVFITHGGPFTQASVRLTTSASGTGPTIALALYEMNLSTGLPGKRLANFGTVSATTTAPATVSSTALTTPVPLVSGWYWQALLFTLNGGSGSCVVKAFTPLIGPCGVSMGNNGPVEGLLISTQTALNDPATAPNALVSGSSPVIPLVSYL